VKIHCWGAGPRVVLVHGPLLGGRHAWREQRSLGERWELIAPDRPGHGETPSKRQDFEPESVELANQLLTQPVHLVGSSYGAIVAMLAAVRAADNVVSLTVIEPPSTSVACGDPVVDDFANAVRAVIDDADAAPDRFLRRFCEVVGVPAHVLPDPPLRVLIKGVRQLQGARPPDEAMLPLDDLAASGFPMLVVSGGHHPASEIICDTIAGRTGGQRAVCPGMGHLVQDTGAPFNALLENFLQSAEANRISTIGDRTP